jgi:hypothetical protein
LARLQQEVLVSLLSLQVVQTVLLGTHLALVRQFVCTVVVGEWVTVEVPLLVLEEPDTPECLQVVVAVLVVLEPLLPLSA